MGKMKYNIIEINMANSKLTILQTGLTQAQATNRKNELNSKSDGTLKYITAFENPFELEEEQP